MVSYQISGTILLLDKIRTAFYQGSNTEERGLDSIPPQNNQYLWRIVGIGPIVKG